MRNVLNRTPTNALDSANNQSSRSFRAQSRHSSLPLVAPPRADSWSCGVLVDPANLTCAATIPQQPLPPRSTKPGAPLLDRPDGCRSGPPTGTHEMPAIPQLQL